MEGVYLGVWCWPMPLGVLQGIAIPLAIVLCGHHLVFSGLGDKTVCCISFCLHIWRTHNALLSFYDSLGELFYQDLPGENLSVWV